MPQLVCCEHSEPLYLGGTLRHLYLVHQAAYLNVNNQQLPKHLGTNIPEAILNVAQFSNLGAMVRQDGDWKDWGGFGKVTTMMDVYTQ